MAKTPRRSSKKIPKTTRPEAKKRRPSPPARSTAEKVERRLDAYPDRIDIRDWFYQPQLLSLPDQLINCHAVPKILDQGREGACTGFALAAVVNFLLHQRGLEDRFVSPRMLYEMARRYDEWPGENYEGSSARGGMKGWVRHGVCPEDLWKPNQKGLKYFNPDIEKISTQVPGGAFYRVMHRQIRDMHAALNEVGILYCTLMVHSGWDDPGAGDALPYSYSDRHGNIHKWELPVIKRRGRADGGHAVAIIGYTHEGFVIQNSWGEEWGNKGFALLPYDDYMMHAVDVWVAQLGVPVNTDIWVDEKWTDSTAGRGRVEEAIRLNQIRPHVIDVGNNGQLSLSGDYWTTESDLDDLFTKVIPEKTADWSKRRLLLYLHGGLNNEKAVAKRILAFRDVMLANELYPVHIMWETGVFESLKSIIADYFTEDDRAEGVGEWLKKLREGLIEAKDRTFELTVSAPGRALWNEMKENARLASSHGSGAVRAIHRRAQRAMKNLDAKEREKWELHIVAHSAGSIFAGHALPTLADIGIPIRSIQLMAPAITTDDFGKLYLPVLRGRKVPSPTLYILSDAGERDDTVGPYGKSLLYLVSNAFEDRRGMPLLGMERYIRRIQAAGNDHEVVPEIEKEFRKTLNGNPNLVIAGAGTDIPNLSRSDSHGGFDNDAATMNSVLWRILGEEPKRPFEVRDLQY